jgi:CubicO group peptidase (beta-lactamase class C family)
MSVNLAPSRAKRLPSATGRVGMLSPLLLFHNGGTGGFRSFAGFVPATATAVAVLSNSARSVDALGSRILERIGGLEAWSLVRGHRPHALTLLPTAARASALTSTPSRGNQKPALSRRGLQPNPAFGCIHGCPSVPGVRDFGL